MNAHGPDSQTGWVVKTVLTLGVLALTALLGFDRARIVEDSRAGVALGQRAEHLAQKVEGDQRVLEIKTLAELKELRGQLSQVLEQQRELLNEVRKRRYRPVPDSTE